MKFKVGDKVKAKNNISAKEYYDVVGTIIEIDNRKCVNGNIRVSYDNGDKLWCYSETAKLIDSKNDYELHITTNGRHTYAVKKQNGKVVARAEAKCHEDDEFDFNVGVNLCLERLGMKNEEVKENNALKFEVGDIVVSDDYPNFNKCVVVKMSGSGAYITPFGHDEYTMNIAKTYMIEGLIEHKTAYFSFISKLHKVEKIS